MAEPAVRTDHHNRRSECARTPAVHGAIGPVCCFKVFEEVEIHRALRETLEMQPSFQAQIVAGGPGADSKMGAELLGRWDLPVQEQLKILGRRHRLMFVVAVQACSLFRGLGQKNR